MKLKQRLQEIETLIEDFLLEKQPPFMYCGQSNINTWRQTTNRFDKEFREKLKFQAGAYIRLYSDNIDLLSLQKLASGVSDYLAEYLMRAPGYNNDKERAQKEIYNYLGGVADRVKAKKHPQPAPVKNCKPIEVHMLGQNGEIIHRVFETKTEYNKFMRSIYQK